VGVAVDVAVAVGVAVCVGVGVAVSLGVINGTRQAIAGSSKMIKIKNLPFFIQSPPFFYQTIID
jgi:hypothetical protein